MDHRGTHRAPRLNPARAVFIDFVLERPEIRRQSWFGFLKNANDGGAIGGRELRVFASLVFSREDGPQPRIISVLRGAWKHVECGGIDHVAAGIAQEALSKIQLPQAAAPADARTAGGKQRLESRGRLKLPNQGRFIDKE